MSATPNANPNEKKKDLPPKGTFIKLDMMLSAAPEVLKRTKYPAYEERKFDMEKRALLEEKERKTKEKEEDFDESEHEFKGEKDLELPPSYSDHSFRFKTVESNRRGMEKTFFLVGYATISGDLRKAYGIPKTAKPVHGDEASQYLAMNSKNHPYLTKTLKNAKLREVNGFQESLSRISMKSLLTSKEIEKRAEVMARLYVNYSKDELRRMVLGRSPMTTQETPASTAREMKKEPEKSDVPPPPPISKSFKQQSKQDIIDGMLTEITTFIDAKIEANDPKKETWSRKREEIVKTKEEAKDTEEAMRKLLIFKIQNGIV